MLDELATEQQASGAAREGAHQSAAGNPKAQRRVFDRFTAQLGKYLLSSGLTTGKNAKFWMGVEYWTVTSANPDDGTIGPNAWLVGIRSEMEGLGRGQPMQAHTSEMVALSRHALERLVQRGAVATNEDLVTIMRNGWTTLTLAQPADEQAPEEVRLVGGRPAQELVEDPPPLGRRAASRRRLYVGDRAIGVGHGQRRLGRRRALHAVHRRVADADPPLARHAREEPCDDGNLFRLEPGEELGEDRDLPRARARGRDLVRGEDDVGEQRHRRRGT